LQRTRSARVMTSKIHGAITNKNQENTTKLFLHRMFFVLVYTSSYTLQVIICSRKALEQSTAIYAITRHWT